MSELNVWLTNVSKLEETKPNKQLKSLYSRKDRSEADAIRAEALEGVDNPLRREKILEELEFAALEKAEFEESRKRKLEESKDGDDVDDMKDFEFGPKHGRFDQPTNSKKDLVTYLEAKSKVISLCNSKLSRHTIVSINMCFGIGCTAQRFIILRV